MVRLVSLFVAALGLVASGLVAPGAPGWAADFPSQPVRMIVPWPAGGTTDIVMRAFAETAAKTLGGQIITDNRPGATGTLGATALVGAKPDGYTLSQMPITVYRQPFLTKTAFDPLTDFTYIINLTGYTFGVVVKADAPWKTFDELIAYAKAHPGEVSYATPGIGSSLHITMEQIGFDRGVQWLHVPYKGSSETTNAVLTGQVKATADSTGWAPFVKSGQFRLLVTWGNERTKQFPDVPTLKELGYGIVSNSPYGVAGPKGMDPALVKQLHDAFKKALDDPGFGAVMEKYDQEAFYMDSAAYTKFAKDTLAEQKVLIEKLGLKQ
jgi:tripartite-type tricarboxylate transporter receptor subunit TctC